MEVNNPIDPHQNLRQLLIAAKEADKAKLKFLRDLSQSLRSNDPVISGKAVEVFKKLNGHEFKLNKPSNNKSGLKRSQGINEIPNQRLMIALVGAVIFSIFIWTIMYSTFQGLMPLNTIIHEKNLFNYEKVKLLQQYFFTKREITVKIPPMAFESRKDMKSIPIIQSDGVKKRSQLFSPPLVITIVVLLITGYFGYKKWKQRQEQEEQERNNDTNQHNDAIIANYLEPTTLANYIDDEVVPPIVAQVEMSIEVQMQRFFVYDY